MNKQGLSVAVAALVSIVCVGARADVLPLDAGGTNQASVNFGPGSVALQNYDFPTLFTASAGGSSTTVRTGLTTPFVSVLSSTTAAAQSIASGESSFNYYYVVAGATGPIPVLIGYELSIYSTNGGFVVASMSVTGDYPYAVPQYEDALSTEMDGFDGSADVRTIAATSAIAGEQNQVFMNVSAETVGGISGQTAYGFVDPYIYIDPAYLALNPGASLQVSAGVGNLPPVPVAVPVPEPATWALLLVGVGLVSVLSRRRSGLAARLDNITALKSGEGLSIAQTFGRFVRASRRNAALPAASLRKCK